MFDALIGGDHDSALLWVLATNPSRFFYEAMGGRRIAERDEKFWGHRLHEVAYGWRLLAPLFSDGLTASIALGRGMHPTTMTDHILIIDFGSQVTQLIAQAGSRRRCVL